MIPEEVFKQLLDIEEEFPGAVVSGGFLRDSLLGVPVRDIDIVVSTNRFSLRGMGFHLETEKMVDADYQHDRIAGVWTRGDYNVIEISQFVSALDQNSYNDIGLCKISWSFREGLILDPAFIKDALNQTLTVYRHDWGQEGVEKHMARLKAKFPNYQEVWDA